MIKLPFQMIKINMDKMDMEGNGGTCDTITRQKCTSIAQSPHRYCPNQIKITRSIYDTLCVSYMEREREEKKSFIMGHKMPHYKRLMLG